MSPLSSCWPFVIVVFCFFFFFASEIGKWDAVVTCFFIDTAKNIVDYLETIYKILKKGGVWINAGKLPFPPDIDVPEKLLQKVALKSWMLLCMSPCIQHHYNCSSLLLPMHYSHFNLPSKAHRHADKQAPATIELMRRATCCCLVPF